MTAHELTNTIIYGQLLADTRVLAKSALESIDRNIEMIGVFLTFAEERAADRLSAHDRVQVAQIRNYQTLEAEKRTTIASIAKRLGA